MMESERGPGGIPKAHFIEHVPDYLATRPSFSSNPKLAVEDALLQLQEALSKYKFVSAHSIKKHSSLVAKITEIKKSTEAIRFIKAQANPITVDYELGDTLYVKAQLEPSKDVFLWLGASVLLAYDVDEALALLSEKSEALAKGLLQLEEEIGFLREQMTTVEVNISRVYNWHIQNIPNSK